MIFKISFKPTIRHLLRDKGYLLVNILSLSAGLICCLFIFKYVLHERSYDRFHEEADRMFRIEIEVFSEDGASSRYAILGTSPVDWLDQIPEIELETRFAQYNWDMNVDVNEKQFIENGIIAADSTFFQLFSFSLLKGNPQTVLKKPNSIVISKSTAQKYFGTTDVLGETLLISFLKLKAQPTITGVVEDVPSNSHFSFNIVASADASEKLSKIHIRDSPTSYSYIRVSEHASTAELEQKLNDLYAQHAPKEASRARFHVKPLTAIHLYSSAIRELSANSNATYVYLFAFIAVIILAIACINFTTLATARSVKRARETAMRKVFGAEKSSLMAAFLVEGALLSFAGLILAYLFAWFLLPHFNLLAGKSISFAGLISPWFFLSMIGVTVVIGILAEWYPALVLSRYKPATLLQKNVVKGSRGELLWKSMVVAQIAISMLLISGTYIVQKQIHFIFTKDLGFDKEQIITFHNLFGGQRETFMKQLEKHPNIFQTTVSSYIPGTSKTAGMSTVEAEGKSNSMRFQAVVVDPEFFDIYGIPIIEGRNFSRQLASDSTQAFIINETAVKSLGWEDPLGKQINAYGRDGFIIGVVKDFNFVSLHSDIAPMVFLMYGRHHAWISAKIRSSQELPETLSYIESTWNKLLPGFPFKYNFVDDQFEALYASEQRARSLFFSFSVLAVIIAILGLFSFASYTIQQKTREIGIRKVLGASVSDILKQFYTGYVKLLLIAALIALPVGYIWMNNWLQNFSYRTEIGLGAFAIPLMLALVILVLAVSYQVVKGALQNPADTIRVE